ncbi:MAG TPA: hypothetical protein VIM28_07930, partial [Solirubrobacterales bacterium]
MKRAISILALALAVAACLPAAAAAHYPASGNFGINGFDVTFSEADGTPAIQAGSHPFAMTATLGANVDGESNPEGWLRDFFLDAPNGFLADPTAYPRCTSVEFLLKEEFDTGGTLNGCQLKTQVGISAASISSVGSWQTSAIFNLVPPPGSLARFGYTVAKLDVIVDVGLRPEPPYNGVASARNVLQLVKVFGSKFQLWGDPAGAVHDESRGRCGLEIVTGLPPGPDAFEFDPTSDESCPVAPNPKPFLTLPTTCAEPLRSSFEAFSWEGESDTGSAPTHDAGGNPIPFSECGSLIFKPSIVTTPTSRAAHSPTGLDLSLNVEDEGLTSLGGRSQSRIRKVVVTLPEGMTANPSVAEGLEVCSEADLARETLQAAPGEGCPQESKLGTVEVESPLVEEPLKGSLFQATPHHNLAGDSLLAFYIVIKSPKLGIIVKQTAKVEPDARTGQLVGITEEIPQLPFSHFRLHFREGGRSPLASPPLCGSYETKAQITPWSGQAPIETSSSFQIVSGPGESPCPPGGTPPFEPGFQAGSQNNSAGAYSPFAMRLTRRDGDQDLTRFDATLPPGVLAKLAGVDKCPDAQIALAKAKTGLAELASPSCPLNSRIGGVIGGAGVGSQLTYVHGSIYLA